VLFYSVPERNLVCENERRHSPCIHHYQSTAHEVLCIYSGWVLAKLVGEKGIEHKSHKGDIIFIPAGVTHKNLDSSSDFMVVGAYPQGQRWDMNYGREGERPDTDKRIAGVPLPNAYLVYGKEGFLIDLWE
jgi:uncharacterized protein YjlB